MSSQPAIRLSEFIRTHMEDILQGWENFARTIEPPATLMDVKALRNHASHMLVAIAEDLDTPQTVEEEITKSEGHGPRGSADTAAETHAAARLISGYTVEQLASEYRALRSSVLRLWSRHSKEGLSTDPDDITRFNEAIDQALAESIARYSKLVNQSRNLFLAMLGHDLRNPLGSTINGAQLLLVSDSLNDRNRDIANRIHRSGLRMGKLVDDLIDFTRTHLGESLPVNPTPSDIGDIAKSTIDEILISNQERIITLDVSGDMNGVWDEGRIAQVISNLVGNAIQHGSTNGAVTVTLQGSSEEIRLSVNNQGTGITEDAIETIFDPMIRNSEDNLSHPHHKTSLGLGLYISREIVRVHGGSINVTSLPEEGTTFTVQLPKTAPA